MEESGGDGLERQRFFVLGGRVSVRVLVCVFLHPFASCDSSVCPGPSGVAEEFTPWSEISARIETHRSRDVRARIHASRLSRIRRVFTCSSQKTNQGVSKENVPKVEALVLETLTKIAEDGFDQEAIDASINSVEFNLREFNTGSFPRCVLKHLIAEREGGGEGGEIRGTGRDEGAAAVVYGLSIHFGRWGCGHDA